MIFELPADTLCPLGGVDYNGQARSLCPPGKSAKLHCKKSGGVEVSCSSIYGCGKKHSRAQFESNPNVFRIFEEAFAHIRLKPEVVPEISTTEQRPVIEPVVESVIEHVIEAAPEKKKPGRPRKTLEKDEIDQKFLHAKEKLMAACAELAMLSQERVRSSPKTEKKEKEKASASYKTIIWKQHYGSAESTDCPVCETNRIYPDNYSLGHIHPESFGGEMTDINLMPICSGCNSMMADKHLFYYAWEKHHRFFLEYFTRT